MIPLYKPHMPILPELNSIIYSDRLTYGKYGEYFEKRLREFIGCDFLLTTNSFNSAINVLITVLGLKAGDKVVASPLSCLASTQPLIAYGLEIIWCDVLPSYGTLDGKYLDMILKNNNVKVVFHNHFAGIIGEVEIINKIAKKYSVPVIDDGIEAFGGEYKGKKLGNLGSFATIFSFGPVRIPTTIDGGAIVFESKEFFDIATLVRDTGINRSSFRDKNGEISSLSDVTYPGHSAMLDDLRSYIGYMQMNYVENIILKQRNNAKLWAQLENCDDINIIYSASSNFNYWVFPTLVGDKKKMINFFLKNGFKTSSIHYPNHFYSVFNNKPYLSGVEYFHERFLALPSGWWVDLNEYIETILEKLCEKD
jgi:perosamine synthetase